MQFTATHLFYVFLIFFKLTINGYIWFCARFPNVQEVQRRLVIKLLTQTPPEISTISTKLAWNFNIFNKLHPKFQQFQKNNSHREVTLAKRNFKLIQIWISSKHETTPQRWNITLHQDFRTKHFWHQQNIFSTNKTFSVPTTKLSNYRQCSVPQILR